MDSHEYEVINELLNDFATDDSITPELVQRQSWERFLLLEEDLVLQKRLAEQFLLQENVFDLATLVHKWIFHGLFSFAGSPRLSSDPYKGVVFFGGIKSQRRTHKFRGSAPHLIKEHIEKAGKELKGNNTDPLENALRFYQRFVHIHPFYDANGRIARFITNCYLSHFSYRIGWNRFDGNQKFLKKLNWVHNSQSDESFKVLTDYVWKFTFSIKEFENED